MHACMLHLHSVQHCLCLDAAQHRPARRRPVKGQSARDAVQVATCQRGPLLGGLHALDGLQQPLPLEAGVPASKCAARSLPCQLTNPAVMQARH
jgi:hypothetical protein